jgi:hypothetical protein
MEHKNSYTTARRKGNEIHEKGGERADAEDKMKMMRK